MDTLTHITLGICTGELLLSKKAGKKVLLWGAIAQNFPDVDILGGFFVSPDRDLLFHRGITHSFVFALIAGLLLAWLAKIIHEKNNLQFKELAFFFVFEIVLHDLLDTCNSYGTGLLEPFNHHRFSVNLLYVADPLFTIGLFVVSIFLIVKSIKNNKRRNWAWVAIGLSVLYLGFASISKACVDRRVNAAFRKQNINPVDYFTTPTPLNSMLWYIVAAADTGYYTGYSSVWDNKNRLPKFERHQKNYSLLNNSADLGVTDNLGTFAAGFYTISKTNNVLYFNVLRFGQVQGWLNSDAPFTLSYPLVAGHAQYLLIQKGRLSGWNSNTIKKYAERIAGGRANENIP